MVIHVTIKKKYKWGYGVRNFGVHENWWGFVFVINIGYFPFLDGIPRTDENIQAVREFLLYYKKKW